MARVSVLAAAAVVAAVTATAASVAVASPSGAWSCSSHSSKPGYRCTRVQVTNLSPWNLTLVSKSVDHSDWQTSPPAVIGAGGGVGAWETNSHCPLLDCFYGSSPSVTLASEAGQFTVAAENDLDKFLYGCNSVNINSLPNALEGKLMGTNGEGCYCCKGHPAPCDCNAFINMNHYEALLSVAAVPTVTSLRPAALPSAGGAITVTGQYFANSASLACMIGTSQVPATWLSDTQITCKAPPLDKPGTTSVALSVSNLGTRWSAPSNFDYVATNSGAKAIVASQTVQNLLRFALPLVAKAATANPIPSIYTCDTVIGITVCINLTDVAVSQLSFGQVSVSTTAERGLQLTASGASVVTSMGWSFVDKGTIIKGNGTATDSIGMDMSIAIGFAHTADGHLTVGDVSASMDVTKLDISTEPKAVEIVTTLLKGVLKSMIAKEVSGAIQSSLASVVNGALAQVPPVTWLGPVGLDFGLLFDPAVLSTGLEFYMKAEAWYGNATAPRVVPPFAPRALPDPPSPPASMSYVLLSDFLANSLLWQLYNAGVIAFRVTPSMIPPSVPIHLNTSLFGDIIPPLAKLYPDRPFEIQINATGPAPFVTLGELPGSFGPGVRLEMHLDLGFIVTCAKPSQPEGGLRGAARAAAGGEACAPVNATTVSANVTAQLGNLAVGNGVNGTEQVLNITGHLEDLHFGLDIVESNIGNYTTSGLNMLCNMMLRAVALGMINQKLDAGILVPAKLGSLQFLNTSLAFDAGYFTFATDIALDSEGEAGARPGGLVVGGTPQLAQA